LHRDGPVGQVDGSPLGSPGLSDCQAQKRDRLGAGWIGVGCRFGLGRHGLGCPAGPFPSPARQRQPCSPAPHDMHVFAGLEVAARLVRGVPEGLLLALGGGNVRLAATGLLRAPDCFGRPPLRLAGLATMSKSTLTQSCLALRVQIRSWDSDIWAFVPAQRDPISLRFLEPLCSNGFLGFRWFTRWHFLTYLAVPLRIPQMTQSPRNWDFCWRQVHYPSTHLGEEREVQHARTQEGASQ
jgi:hypothetical protein